MCWCTRKNNLLMKFHFSIRKTACQNQTLHGFKILQQLNTVLDNGIANHKKRFNCENKRLYKTICPVFAQ
jgi:hypothetical protein